MLECRIIKDFKNFRLDVDFSMGEESLALLGASGAGKSLTLKSIAGLIKPDAGRIVLNNRVLFDSEKKINLKPQDRKVGYLFQDYALFPNFTVEENIETGLRQGDTSRVEQVIKDLHIEHIKDKYPHMISGGEKQRAALARILVNRAEILLLDEPFSAIDSFMRDKVENEVVNIIKKYKIKTILVSHNKEESYRLCDNIVTLNGGRSEGKLETDELFKNPPTITAAKLVGIKNFSRVKHEDSGKISALDWGMSLKAGSKPIKKYVGVFSNKIKISGEKMAENSFPLGKYSLIENIDNYSVTREGGSQGIDNLIFTVDKEVWKSLENPEKYITIEPEDLIFFDD